LGCWLPLKRVLLQQCWPFELLWFVAGLMKSTLGGAYLVEFFYRKVHKGLKAESIAHLLGTADRNVRW